MGLHALLMEILAPKVLTEVISSPLYCWSKPRVWTFRKESDALYHWQQTQPQTLFGGYGLKVKKKICLKVKGCKRGREADESLSATIYRQIQLVSEKDVDNRKDEWMSSDVEDYWDEKY